MQSITTYLLFQGHSEQAMTFYKSVLGGEFTNIQRFKDLPGGERMPAHEQELMMHITLTLPNDLVLMATDTLESMGQQLTIGDNFKVCLNTESAAEADKIFSGLSDGGEIDMPMNETMWGAYFGMLKDKFGVQWMVSYSNPKK